MEADSCLQLTEEIYEKWGGKVYVSHIVSDDDSTMKALLKHNTPLTKKGKLRADVPQPEWLADPTHRCKVLSKGIYALAALPK